MQLTAARHAVAAWSLVVLIGLVHVRMALRLPGGPDGMSDLHVYVLAARAVLAGQDPYQVVSFNGDGFVYPPSAGLLLAAVGLPPETVVRVGWTVLQWALAVGLSAMVLARSQPPLLSRLPRRVALPVLSCLLLVSYPVFTGLFLGQVSLLVTVLTLLDALDLTPRRLRGVPTGVAAALKLTPLALVPYLWLTGRRRPALVAAAAFVLAAGLGWLVLPGPSGGYWSSVLTVPPYVDLAQLDNQSVQGLLARTGWSGPLRTGVLLGLSGLVLGLGYRRSREAHRRGEALAGAVIVGAVTVLVSPISWSHHQTVLVLAACCAVGASRARNLAFAVGVLVLTTLPLPFLLDPAWPLYPLLSELVLLLALLVACALPLGSRSDKAAEPELLGRGRLEGCD